jgi:hypothetical protein
MDYPKYPKSTPLSGKQAERVRETIRTGGSITNEAYERTIDRIIEQIKKRKAKENAEAKSALQQD